MKKYKKIKLNSKRGISLILAIALSMVLFMTTTGFISIAMMQQEETGSEMDTRQAYVSAKSALDVAQELINDENATIIDAIKKLTNINDSVYFAFYYDSLGNLVIITSTDKTALLNEMENLEKDPDIEFIGDAIVRIKKQGTNDYTLTAYGKEDIYTTKDDSYSERQISIEFEASEKEIIVTYPGEEIYSTHTKYYQITTPEITTKTISSPSATPFLMVGAQTNFSLMKSSYYKLWSQDKGFQTAKQYYKANEGDVVFIPQLNTDDTPLDSQFPIVFTDVVKIDSEGRRCTYKAYDQGIYFLGTYSGTTELSDYHSSNAKDVCFFTNNNFYGCVLECRFLTINGNMVARTDVNGSLTVKHSGSDSYTYNGMKGVVVYFSKDCTLSTYNTDGNEITKNTKKYTKGYYWLPTPTAGAELFNPNNGMTKISTSDSRYTQLNGIDLTSSLIDSNGNVKKMHSAFESVESKDKTKAVSILYNNGTFQKSNYNYSTSQRTSFYDGWNDYSIYCGPSRMPSSESYTQYYDMYCGKSGTGGSFNFLWYNIYDMEVNKNVKMSIRSSNTVLTIGPDTGEQSYVISNSSCSLISNSVLSGHNIVSGPYKTSNTLVGSSGGEFWICPYWNESSYTLTVMNDFNVKLSNGTTYTIKAGDYTDLPANGINLLSTDAKNFFTNYTSNSVVDANEASDCNWVSGGVINNPSSLTDMSDYAVDFVASSGSLVSGGNYKATAIYCDFSDFNNMLNGNGATLTADFVSIDAQNIKGDLYINTKSGYDKGAAYDYNGDKSKGHILWLKSDCTIYSSNSEEKIIELKAGYYFFATTNDCVNLCDKKTWNKQKNIEVFYVSNANTKYGVTTSTSTKSGSITNTSTDINIKFEGAYY